MDLMRSVDEKYPPSPQHTSLSDRIQTSIADEQPPCLCDDQGLLRECLFHETSISLHKFQVQDQDSSCMTRFHFKDSCNKSTWMVSSPFPLPPKSKESASPHPCFQVHGWDTRQDSDGKHKRLHSTSTSRSCDIVLMGRSTASNMQWIR